MIKKGKAESPLTSVFLDSFVKITWQNHGKTLFESLPEELQSPHPSSHEASSR
jgi:hypothetical protein